ncbi:hypothetical protein [Ulvibacter litoralis]|uniref:hypothetical protein n=1 Tax=Ulvibacter litoralis TaxID=227084 RepID=UPI001586B14B|nr:hypothetical protein [Ulvibacter litoralis]
MSFETGLQIGLIIKQTGKILESPTNDPNFNTTANHENTTLDFGIAIGVNYELNKNLL